MRSHGCFQNRGWTSADCHKKKVGGIFLLLAANVFILPWTKCDSNVVFARAHFLQVNVLLWYRKSNKVKDQLRIITKSISNVCKDYQLIDDVFWLVFRLHFQLFSLCVEKEDEMSAQQITARIEGACGALSHIYIIRLLQYIITYCHMFVFPETINSIGTTTIGNFWNVFTAF